MGFADSRGVCRAFVGEFADCLSAAPDRHRSLQADGSFADSDRTLNAWTISQARNYRWHRAPEAQILPPFNSSPRDRKDFAIPTLRKFGIDRKGFSLRPVAVG